MAKSPFAKRYAQQGIGRKVKPYDPGWHAKEEKEREEKEKEKEKRRRLWKTVNG